VDNGRRFALSNNIAPQGTAPVVTGEEIQLMTWGTELGGNTVINARSETIESIFARDITDHRCVIPADGYFEWARSKRPFFFKVNSGDLIFLAGFYNYRQEFVVLTRPAAGKVPTIHHRMPIVLTIEQLPIWQGPHWAALMSEKPPDFNFYPVANFALISGSTGEECVKPMSETSKSQKSLDEAVKLQVKEAVKSIL
jgi:putative SOS response-associated peptidase YedK